MAEPAEDRHSKRSGGRRSRARRAAQAQDDGHAPESREPASNSSASRSTSASGAKKPQQRRAARREGRESTARSASAKRIVERREANSGRANRAAPRRSARATARERAAASRHVKHVASKAKGPAVAVGAAAAGVAGGLGSGAGTPQDDPRRPGPKHLPAVDPQAMLKSVGSASKQFAKTSKSVSKDIERAGDQAERIGKILGSAWPRLDARGGRSAQRGREGGEAVASTARRTPGPVRAAGFAAAGLAGGLALGARSRPA